jgi:FtsP/CotA-like multicopper oxidase with cupredoxin domain
LFWLLVSTAVLPASAQTGGAPAGHVRTYYIAADEVDWNYLPSGKDQMMGMAPMGYAKAYTQPGPGLIGSVYRKAIYREYTDATFTRLKPRAAADAYLGLLGPTIYAEAGDTIKVVFRNHGTHPYSVHPHGVLYEKASEGSLYSDGVAAQQKGGDSVAPGATFTYTWAVTDQAAPGPNDPSSIVWPYHSHVDERRDVNSGLIGAIVVTRAGMAREDGSPKDVDHQFVLLFMIFDENHSWFIDDNIKRIKVHKKNERLSNSPLDPAGVPDPVMGTGFVASNFRNTMNGYQYANMPMMVMKRGDRVRWYVMTVGIGFNFHTPHWHGNTVLYNGHRVDVLNLGPAQSLTADMVPDDPGIWLVHCHLSDHMEAGMSARYQVLP